MTHAATLAAVSALGSPQSVGEHERRDQDEHPLTDEADFQPVVQRIASVRGLVEVGGHGPLPEADAEESQSSEQNSEAGCDGTRDDDRPSPRLRRHVYWAQGFQ
jgi:hypothetical protein